MKIKISINLEEETLQRAKEVAQHLGIGYQAVIQNILRYQLFGKGNEDVLGKKEHRDLIHALRNFLLAEIKEISKDL